MLEQWPAIGRHLVDLFLFGWYTYLIEQALLARPALSSFQNETQATAVARFRQLDRRFLQQNRHRLATAHWHQIPKIDAGGLVGELVTEAQKKAGHRPIRQLVSDCGPLIQQIKRYL